MIVSLIMAFLCLSVFAFNVSAASFKIGIKTGDWVKYTYTVTGSFPYGDFSNVTWIKVEFTNVTNTTTEQKVGVLMIYHVQNGTETNQTTILDLQSEPAGYYGLLIPANSSVGDTFNMGGTTITIQNETTRTYAGATRTVLSALAQPGTNATNYWDKQTGVMMEATSIFSTYNINIAVTETNMWTAGFLGLDWWWWITIIVIIAGIITLAALMLHRRKSAPPAPSAQQAPPPPPPPPLPQ